MHAIPPPASPLLSPITSASASPSSPSPTRTTFTDVFSTSRTPSPSPADLTTPTRPTISSLPPSLKNTQTSSNTTNHPSDIPRLRTTHVTAGYRDGISSSKTAALQPGFDEGYPLGATLGIRVGYILGVLEGIVAALRHTFQSRACEKSGVKAIGAGTLNGNEEAEGFVKELKRMEKMLADARTELRIDKVFGREVWGEDGVWKYEVEGEEGFEAVAAVHPVVKEWMRRVESERRRWCATDDTEGGAG